jgi:hypothetical protein
VSKKDLSFPDTKFQRWLAARDACYPAREWVAGKTFAAAWDSCERPDWMLWLLLREPKLRRHCARIAVKCSDRVCHLVDDADANAASYARTAAALAGAATASTRAAYSETDAALYAIDVVESAAMAKSAHAAFANGAYEAEWRAQCDIIRSVVKRRGAK